VKVTLKTARSTSAGLPVAGSFNAALRRSGRLSAPLMSGVAVAALLAMGTVAAKADDPSVAVQIKELKAQIRMLEKRMDQQSNVVIRQAQGGPIVKGPYPYAPPEPWDKKFHLNGITITPGGFFAAEGVFRTRDEGANFNEGFGSDPEYNSTLAHMQELRLTAGQSRVSMLVQGNYNPDVLISGYGELDFLGAANTANSNESNSYTPRIRHMYGTIDWQDEGFHILAGQTWSLATLNNKGITPRNEIIPLTIDAQYVVGFNWARQTGIRLTKNFGDDFWIAASAEMPQTTGCPAQSSINAGAVAFPPASVGPPVVVPGVGGITCSQESAGGGLLNQFTTYSLNHIPDVIAKAAWEPTIADRRIHVEGFGLYTDEYDGVQNPAGSTVLTRFDTTGWGGGGSVVVPVMPKLLDLQGSAMIGRGIGRYGSGQLADSTLSPNGSLDALPEIMFLGGATLHATPQLDLYAYGGQERILSTDFVNLGGGNSVGYSSPTADNSGCFIIGGACKGATKDVWEVTAGLWDKVYQGDFGSVRVGLQYEYIQRELFPGTGGPSAPAITPFVGTPKFNENAVYASFRYYPFDPPAAAPALVAKY
jgi:hypothetical protein